MKATAITVRVMLFLQSNEHRLHPIAQRVDYLPLSTLDTDVAVPTRLKVPDTNIRERLITNGFEEERLPVFTESYCDPTLRDDGNGSNIYRRVCLTGEVKYRYP